MTLVFIGIDPNTPGGNCPSVWVDDQTGDMVFQGWEETHEANRADIAARSPILDHERIVRLPARMVPIVRDALEAAGDAEGVPLEELFGQCERSAVHLEARDEYTPDDPVYLDWKAGKAIAPADAWRDWYELMRATVARGVQVRRARIVSEPVTAFIRYEHDLTAALNIAAGELVRWLPRRRTSDLCIPGNDFWIFDNRLVRFGYFAGNGEYLDDELTDDPALVRLCSDAFDRVWERAVDHAAYRPT